MHSKLTASVAAVALLCATRGGAQQCALDLDGSGTTTVNELVVAVNQALNGCGGAPPTPTPINMAGCPYSFDDDNSRLSDPVCRYTGTATNQACSGGSFAANSAWSSDGYTVLSVVVDNSGSIGVRAIRTGSATAQALGISFSPDFDVEYPVSGTVTLPSPGRFSISWTESACGLFTYGGTYLGLSTPSAASAAGVNRDGAAVLGVNRDGAAALRDAILPDAPRLTRTGGDDQPGDRAQLMRDLRSRLAAGPVSCGP